MLHAGLDLSRKRLDVRVLFDAGDTAFETWAPPDRDGLHALVQRVERFGEPASSVAAWYAITADLIDPGRVNISAPAWVTRVTALLGRS